MKGQKKQLNGLLLNKEGCNWTLFMIEPKDKKAFIELFAEKLKKTAENNNKPLDPLLGNLIALRFVNALIELKKGLSADPKTHRTMNGELTWSPQRRTHTEEFANELADIFKPLGGINPKEASAYWSGEGVKQAHEHGVAFGKTIPGAVMNQVSASLQEIFTKQAYKEDGSLDTATNIAVWDAMSLLYAQGTNKNAHVFLVNGETSNQSIFWNTELNTLRERQNKGEIEEIYIHTLKSEALELYQDLLTKRKDIKPDNEEALKNINEKIDGLLKNASNWENSPLDESNAFKLRTSGPKEKHQTIDYQRIKEIAQRFKSLGPTNKTKALEIRLIEINQSLSATGNYEAYKNNLESLRQNIHILKSNKFCSDATLLSLENLEKEVEKNINKASPNTTEIADNAFQLQSMQEESITTNLKQIIKDISAPQPEEEHQDNPYSDVKPQDPFKIR